MLSATSAAAGAVGVVGVLSSQQECSFAARGSRYGRPGEPV